MSNTESLSSSPSALTVRPLVEDITNKDVLLVLDESRDDDAASSIPVSCISQSTNEPSNEIIGQEQVQGAISPLKARTETTASASVTATFEEESPRSVKVETTVMMTTILSEPLLLPNGCSNCCSNSSGRSGRTCYKTIIENAKKAKLERDKIKDMNSNDNNHEAIKQKKRVRFEVDETTNREMRHICPFPPLTLNEIEENLLWVRPEQVKVQKKEAKRLALSVTTADVEKENKNVESPNRYEEYIETFVSLYDMVTCYNDYDYTMQSIKKVYSILSNETHPFRGLESYCFPFVLSDRKYCIQGVLKAQRRFPKEMNHQQRERFLADISVALSRPSKLRARALANADANVALDIHKRTFIV